MADDDLTQSVGKKTASSGGYCFGVFIFLIVVPVSAVIEENERGFSQALPM